ncbi:MAG: hypothetical protein L0323_23500, partial [Planctomycetes bacterium]|nr:hypothetical protein [Planctomycetota bacterium]
MLHVREAKRPREGLDRRHDKSPLGPAGALHLPRPLLELAIGAPEDREELVEPGEEIVLPLVPSLRAAAQCLVV